MLRKQFIPFLVQFERFPVRNICVSKKTIVFWKLTECRIYFDYNTKYYIYVLKSTSQKIIRFLFGLHHDETSKITESR